MNDQPTITTLTPAGPHGWIAHTQFHMVGVLPPIDLSGVTCMATLHVITSKDPERQCMRHEFFIAWHHGECSTRLDGKDYYRVEYQQTNIIATQRAISDAHRLAIREDKLSQHLSAIADYYKSLRSSCST